MRLLRHKTRTTIHLDTSTPLHIGGEGRIYSVAEDPGLVAKIYNPDRLTEERIRKLCVMIGYPPENKAVAVENHVPIAWPLDLLRSVDDGHRVVGLLMPKVEGMYPVSEFYNPRARRTRFPRFTTRYLHRTARNLAAAVHTLHTAGYVIGDMSESNIFVSNTAVVTLVDTDSFQVANPETGAVHRCAVGRPEFTPPELQGADFGRADRTPAQDHFGLAVLIFQLLMEGTHPFEGIYEGPGDPPSYEQRIASGHFPYGSSQDIPYRPKPGAPTFHTLYPLLQSWFIQCFEKGRTDPMIRPDARSWQTALEQAEYTLTLCPDNPQHLYDSHCEHCPWCLRASDLGLRDPFPSEKDKETGDLHRPLRRPAPSDVKTPAILPSQFPIFTPTSPQPIPSPDALASPFTTHIPIAGWMAAGCLALLIILKAGLHPAIWLGVLATGCGITGWQKALTGHGTSMAWAALSLGVGMLLLFLLSDW